MAAMPVVVPQPHFPSRYLRPTVAPTAAVGVVRPDGARIAAFVYAPDDATTQTGDPVLMLHGNGEEHGIFGPTIDALVAQRRSVIAIDSRAQGHSTRGSDRLTYELLCEDNVAVLDHFNIACCHVLGFSDGAIEALLLARDHPSRISSITAMGANLTPEGVMAEPDWDIAGLVAENRRWAQVWSDAYGSVDTSLLTPTPQEAAASADLLQLMLDEPHIPATSLAAISCPATIMVGEFDCIADYETCAIAQAIPRARLVVVPGAGHTLPKHAPDSVTRELLATISTAESYCDR